MNGHEGPLIFFHLQKTGGTTVDSLLRKHLSGWEFASKDRSGKISDVLVKAQRFVLSGHFTAAELPTLTSAAFVTTVLREPTERLLSHCYFLKSYAEGNLETYKDAFLMKVKRTPMRDLLLDGEFIDRFSDFYVRKLDPAYEAGQPGNTASLERATQFLQRCNLLGQTGKLDAYCCQLLEALGIRARSDVPALNSRSVIENWDGFERAAREELREVDAEAIENVIGRDRVLYNYTVGMTI